MRLTRLLIAFAFIFGVIGSADARVIVNDRFEEPFTTFIPCADEGAGELAEGLVTWHLLIRENVDNADGYHFGGMIHPINTVLTGLTTGDEYIVTGGTQERFNVMFGDMPFTWTFTNSEITVGKGDAANMTLHETLHFTINAQGEVTTEVENAWVTCK